MLAFEITFLALQTIVVVFLLFHDWVPLGRLNNLTAIRSQDSVARSVFVTLLPAVPAALGEHVRVRGLRDLTLLVERVP